jgi:hypothetical protein
MHGEPQALAGSELPRDPTASTNRRPTAPSRGSLIDLAWLPVRWLAAKNKRPLQPDHVGPGSCRSFRSRVLRADKRMPHRWNPGVRSGNPQRTHWTHSSTERRAPTTSTDRARASAAARPRGGPDGRCRADGRRRRTRLRAVALGQPPIGDVQQPAFALAVRRERGVGGPVEARSSGGVDDLAELGERAP